MGKPPSSAGSASSLGHFRRCDARRATAKRLPSPSAAPATEAGPWAARAGESDRNGPGGRPRGLTRATGLKPRERASRLGRTTPP
eukprot:9575795-Alexandrium_andersonii.AAC.1